MRHAVTSANGHLLLWKSGIDTSRIVFVPGKGCAMRYTYGWPSVLDAPENAGDLPTGIWADVAAGAGTLLIIK